MPANVRDVEVDNGPRRPGAERLCLVTRAVRPVTEMVRFVVGPDEDVVPDLKRRLPGRGVWITARRDTVADAVRRKAFARGFRRDVRVPATLPDAVERLLEGGALDALSIARKAGLVLAGFAKIESALDTGYPIVGLIHAADAGGDGVSKIAAAGRRRFGETFDRIPTVQCFTSMQLDLALGRSNVIHAALLAGSASDGFLSRCRSLEHFRTVEPSGPG